MVGGIPAGNPISPHKLPRLTNSNSRKTDILGAKLVKATKIFLNEMGLGSCAVQEQCRPWEGFWVAVRSPPGPTSSMHFDGWKRDQELNSDRMSMGENL